MATRLPDPIRIGDWFHIYNQINPSFPLPRTHFMTSSSLIFIDSRVSGYQSLLKQLPTSSEVFVIDGASDGLAQIAADLAGRSGIDAIHVISHGSQGALYLGATRVDEAALATHGSELASIGASLGAQGDLLLYGCDVARGEVGMQFIDTLAGLIGADVAASDDVTGVGGDAQLEQTTGSIEATGLALTGLAGSLAATGGIVTTDFGGFECGYDVTVQADGKILVAGLFQQNNNYDFALARYNPDGTLDTTFSGDGKLTTDIKGGNEDWIQSATVQADGKILLAGYSIQNNGFDFALVRYTADGTLDTTFSGDGKLTTNLAAGYDEFGGTVTVQIDDKILIGGVSNGDFALVRYNADGTLDSTFSGDGKLTTDLSNNFDRIFGITLQADGKILAAGKTFNGENGYDFALARYNSDGTLDNTFSDDGRVITDFGGNESGKSVTVQADGKILVAGYGSGDLALARYNTDGSPDLTFDDDGQLTSELGFREPGFNIAIQSDGKILVAGDSYESNNQFALLRYNADGTRDLSFSVDGQLTANFHSYGADYGLTVQADGKILVTDYVGGDFALVRYNADGTLDTTFSSNYAPTGTVTINGITTQGQTLTASNTLADNNGLGTIAYQWLLDGVEISGAIGSTYTLGQSDVGKAIRVMASYTDQLGTAERVGSAATTTVANINDAPTGGVSITGTAAQGETLTATNTLADADGLGTVGYQWQADGVEISGAIGSTYTLGQSDVGKAIRVMASYTDQLGTAERVGSAATTTVANINDAPTGGVSITGTAAQGETLTATNTLADADGLGTVGYQWLRGGTAIGGATGGTYTLTASDVGQAISVRASYTDGQGTAENKISAAIIPIASEPGLVFGDTSGLVITEAGGTDSFTVALRLAPRHNVTVSLTISDATEAVFAASGKATHSLTFTAANWTTAQTVVLRGVDDKVNDGDIGYTISTSIKSADLRYDGMRSGSGLSIANLSAKTTDDDAPDIQYGDKGGVIRSDLLDGGNGASDLYGLLGRDELHGNNGADRLYGGYEDDVLWGEADDDELEGEQGNDKLDGGTGDDSLNGGTGNDSLYGQAGNDNLLGDTGKDTLLGGTGNDTLDGGTNADSMDGGDGADVYYIDNAADVVRDSGTDASVDTVYIMAYLNGGITLGAGIDNGALNDLAGKGKLTGNTGNNALTGNAEENVISGGDGTDTLSGGGGADTLDGGVGADSLAGGTGTDSLVGGAGNDSLGGGAGDDVLYAGDGNDVVDGGDGAGNDTYNGGAGLDTVKYTSATAGITVDLAKGTATSTAGSDAAKIGTDTLSGIENVIAGNYNDIVKGSTGANVLTGGLGSDSLYGGADKLKDVFDFNASTESALGSTRDKVYDFVSKIDQIDLSGINANTTKAGDQAFSFSTISLTTAKANSVWYKLADVDGDKLNDDLIVYGDVNGNTTADFEIGIIGVTSLVTADFVL